MLLILVYFNGMLWAWCQLMRLVVVLPDVQLWLREPVWVGGYVAFLVLIVPVLWRMGRHILLGVLGLVTNRFDESPESNDGIRFAADDLVELRRLVHSVARRIDAPAPDHIFLSPFAECYVAERRRFSLATDRELLLVLGLPHLAVLRVGELEVILGHELAHLRGGDTIMGVFVFRFLESLRLGMDESVGNRWRWIDPLYWFEQSCFSCFVRLAAPLRRYQEFAADRLSADAFGGPLAVQTLLKEWLLAHQFDAEMASLHLSPQRNACVSRPNERDHRSGTVFARFSQRWSGLTAAGQAYLERRLAEEERASVFDSHPTMTKRIAVMREYGPRPGADATPARVLLGDHQESLEKQFHDQLIQSEFAAVEPVHASRIATAHSD